MFIRDGTPSGLSTMSQRRAVRQERHILLRQNAGDNALVSVAASHFVADGDLSALRNVAAYELVHTRRKLVAVFTREDFYVHNDARLAVRHAQRRVAHLARLFAENRAQEAFLRRQLRFTLRRYLADKDIARAHLCADANDAALV